MRVTSVSIAATPILLPGTSVRTGIDKRPVLHAVSVGALGLADDCVCSTKHHGGPDQAVYVYGRADYEWWEATLGRPIADGTFGENLTISDLRSDKINVGDRFRIGDNLIIEATAPRIPCGTFARHMRDVDFPEKFRQAERPGFYCRVIREGEVRHGDTVTMEQAAPAEMPPVSVVELLRSFYRKDDDADTLRWHLSAPIAVRARRAKESQLAKLAP